ncbi:MAG: hypothetical protein VYB15_01375, partial [Planctomycetota bacterium]|nr:hypothetical protein [Planctomycetota bacterium]
ERGVYTTCVGIGDGYSPEQLAVLSEHGGGLLHRAERPHEIIEVLLGELGELMNTYAEDIKVEVNLPGDVIAECVGGLPSTESSKGVSYHLGTLVEGRERHIILRLKCPRGERGKALKFKGRITFKRPGSSKRELVELKAARLEFADSSVSLRKQKRDRKLSLRVASAWQAEVVRNAAGMNRDRAFREAADMVRTELAFFSRYCRGIDGTSRLIQELEMLEDRVRYDISERGRKEMHNYSEARLKSKPEHRAGFSEELCDFME